MKGQMFIYFFKVTQQEHTIGTIYIQIFFLFGQLNFPEAIFLVMCNPSMNEL
jgi:hypothetical protein